LQEAFVHPFGNSNRFDPFEKPRDGGHVLHHLMTRGTDASVRFEEVIFGGREHAIEIVRDQLTESRAAHRRAL
jgi:hypothetical protein